MTIQWSAKYEDGQVRTWTAEFTKSEFKETFSANEQIILKAGRHVRKNSSHVQYTASKV